MEIVSLQIGHFSNFVGSHLWNLQRNELLLESAQTENVFASQRTCTYADAGNPGVTCREVKDKFGHSILVPRLLSVDLKGSLDKLKEDGTVGDDHDETLEQVEVLEKCEVIDQKSSNQWWHQSKVADLSKETEALHSCERQKTQNPIRVWSDFLTTQYHQNSIQLIDSLSYKSNDSAFSSYGTGLTMSKQTNFIDDFEEKLHFFLEECDSPQGIQITADLHDGFGGLTVGLLECLKDTVGNKSIFTVGVWPPSIDIDYVELNSSLALNNIIQHSELVLPISTRQTIGTRTSLQSVDFPFLDYIESSNYHASGILASFVDTMSLPYRSKRGDTTMASLSTFITAGSEKVVASGLCLPLTSTCLMALEQDSGRSCVTSLTPYSNLGYRQNTHCEYIVLRGRNRISGLGPKGFKANQNTPVKEEFKCFFDSSVDTFLAKRYCFDTCLTTMEPYPQFFRSSVLDDPLVIKGQKRGQPFVVSVPSVSRASPSRTLYDLFFQLYVGSRRLKRPTLQSVLESGVEVTDVKENLEELLCLAESHDPNRTDFNEMDRRDFRF